MVARLIGEMADRVDQQDEDCDGGEAGEGGGQGWYKRSLSMVVESKKDYVGGQRVENGLFKSFIL